MQQHIYKLLSGALPTVDFDRDFLFGELDSLGIATIMMFAGEGLQNPPEGGRCHSEKPAQHRLDSEDGGNQTC